MDGGDLEEAIDSLHNLEGEIEFIQKALSAILKYPLKELSKRLSVVESAKLHVSLAYTLNSLFYMYLKTQGEEIGKDHPVKKELERVQKYSEKIVNAQKRKEEGPKRRVDAGVARRLISAGVKRKF
ncbi:hypothetical protein AAMO2058_000702700 [Amorphochlora amoebiformis]